MKHQGTKELSLSARMIALESRTSAKSGSSMNFSRIPAFLDTVVSTVKGALGFQEKSSAKSQPMSNSFTKLLGKSNYVDLADVHIFRPTGMKGTYSDYLDMLDYFQARILDIEKRVLLPASQLITALVSEPSRLSKDVRINVKHADIDDLRQRMAKSIDVSDEADMVRYADAIKRNSDWGSIVKRLDDIAADYNAVGVKNILLRISNISEASRILIETMQSSPDTHAVNGNAIADIVELLHNAALEVEMFAAHGYNIRTMQSALADSYDKLKEVIS